MLETISSHLKPCQFQRTVNIGTVNVTNFDQMPNCSYWQFVVHGQGVIKANESCLTRLQPADIEVSINCGSDGKTFSVLLKPGQRLIKKISNWFEVGLSRSKNTQISQDSMRSDSRLLAAWLRLLTKRSYLSSCLTFGRTFYLSWKQKSCFVMFSL